MFVCFDEQKCQRWSFFPPEFQCFIVALPVLIQQQLLLTCCGTVTPVSIRDSICALNLNQMFDSRVSGYLGRIHAHVHTLLRKSTRGRCGSSEKNLHLCFWIMTMLTFIFYITATFSCLFQQFQCPPLVWRSSWDFARDQMIAVLHITGMYHSHWNIKWQKEKKKNLPECTFKCIICQTPTTLSSLQSGPSLMNHRALQMNHYCRTIELQIIYIYK